MSATTITLRRDDWHLIASALVAEIEHSNDYCRDADDSTDEGREDIIAERKRGERLEDLRTEVLSSIR